METEQLTIDEIVLNAVSETLEGMAFMGVELLDELDEEFDCEEGLLTRLRVLEPFIGRVTIFTPIDLAEKVTSNIYSMMDDSPSASMVKDTISELVNTLAGLIMAELTPESLSFTLGLPDTRIVEEGKDWHVNGWMNGTADGACGGEGESAVEDGSGEEIHSMTNSRIWYFNLDDVGTMTIEMQYMGDWPQG